MTDTTNPAPTHANAAAPATGRAVRRYSADLSAVGEPALWGLGGALAFGVILIVGFLLMISVNGIVTFWPKPIERLELRDGSVLAGVARRGGPYRVGEDILARLDAVLLAHLQEDLERDFALPAQAIDVLGIEIGAAVEADKLAAKHVDIRIILDHGAVTVDLNHVHHGSTPLSFNHLRMLATAPLSVAGDEWGRWYTRRSPKRRTPTREPSRSLSSAPSSMNNPSMSAQLVLPLIGRANISSSVFSCFRLTSV